MARQIKGKVTIGLLLVAIVVTGGIFLRSSATPIDQLQSQNEQSDLRDTRRNESENIHKSEGIYPVVTIETNTGEQIKIELYPDIAPNTVNNFVSLVSKGFYDGTIFHRVIPGFMVQGGDPRGTGTGGPGYSIKGEFNANGFKNDLKHTRGVISMARSGHPDSAGSQFFIMVADSPHLDGQYAAFGRVVSGMEEVDRIVSSPRNAQDRPNEEQSMVKVTVDVGDKEYPEPEKAGS